MVSKNVSNMISYEDEVKRGAYVSGRDKDLTNPQRDVVLEAEKRMYEDKAMFYQRKEQKIYLTH